MCPGTVQDASMPVLYRAGEWNKMRFGEGGGAEGIGGSQNVQGLQALVKSLDFI